MFALATSSALYVYCTDSIKPEAVVPNVHLDTVNDLTWAEDGKKAVLLAASSDGFCSMVDVDLNSPKIGLFPAAESDVPEELRDYYTSRNTVGFEASVDAIKKELAGKNCSFVSIGFRSKKNQQDVTMNAC